MPTRSFTLESSPAAVAQSITFIVKGAAVNAAGGKIHLKVGDRHFRLQPKGENFNLQARAPANANGQTRAEVSLELPSPNSAKPADMLLVVDSIDVSLGGRSSNGEKRS